MGLRERLVASATDIRDRGQRLVQLNLELLTAELKQKGQKFGAAIGLFVGAALFALYAIGFALATIAVALALVLPLWLSLLIVTAVLFLLVMILVLVGRSQAQQLKKPAPEKAVAEAKKTADMVKTNVRQTVDGVRSRVVSGRPPVSPAARPPVSSAGPERPGTAGGPPVSASDTGAKD